MVLSFVVIEVVKLHSHTTYCIISGEQAWTNVGLSATGGLYKHFTGLFMYNDYMHTFVLEDFVEMVVQEEQN